MKLCFNQATTMHSSTLEKDLMYCEMLGYDLIEIRMDKLRDYLTRNSISDLREFFRNSRLKPYAFNALEGIGFQKEENNQIIFDDLRFLCECGAFIGCQTIVCVPNFDVGHKTIADIRDESVREIRKLASFAESFGIRLAYEFVGYPNCSVNTFNQAYDIVQQVNLHNVGLVLDCFHFHAMGSRAEDILKADPNKIFILHIDDSEDLPVGAARDIHRLWPGEGAVPLDDILSALKTIGYQEMVSVELFRPEYYEMDVKECIRTAKEKTILSISPFFSVG